MSDNCIFCDIISGVKEGDIIYEDENVFILWDIRQPKIGGHLLIIPRQHFENIHILPDSLVFPMMQFAKLAANGLKVTRECKGVNLMIANGRSAGQTVFHLHIHLLPRNHLFDIIAYYFNAFLLRWQFPAHKKQTIIAGIRKYIETQLKPSLSDT